MTQDERAPNLVDSLAQMGQLSPLAETLLGSLPPIPLMPLTVYVRKGADDNERRLSFKRPDNIPTSELLARGIAIDGNQAAFSVSGEKMSYDGTEWFLKFRHPFAPVDTVSAVRHTLMEALAEAEVALAAYLAQHGYEATFA